MKVRRFPTFPILNVLLPTLPLPPCPTPRPHLAVEQLRAQALELGVAQLAALIRVELHARRVVQDHKVALALQDHRDRILEVKDVWSVPIAGGVDVALRGGGNDQVVEAE